MMSDHEAFTQCFPFLQCALTSPGQGPDGAGEAGGPAQGPNPRHSGGVGKGGGSAAGGGPVVGC